jgi:CRISPR/Cas system endoribonuclease Cas6 (RAMP superfamily)
MEHRVMSAHRRLDHRSLADTVRNNGGILGAIEYGISADDIDDPEIANAWRRVVDQYAALRPNLVIINRGLSAARRRAA